MINLDAILDELKVSTQEELNFFHIDYILESTDTPQTELDEKLINIDYILESTDTPQTELDEKLINIDYTLESTDTETELDETLIDIDFNEPISITTSTENPLDKQLKALTGDGYSLADWAHAERTDDYILLKHISTGLTVKWMLKK